MYDADHMRISPYVTPILETHQSSFPIEETAWLSSPRQRDFSMANLTDYKSV